MVTTPMNPEEIKSLKLPAIVYVELLCSKSGQRFHDFQLLDGKGYPVARVLIDRNEDLKKSVKQMKIRE